MTTVDTSSIDATKPEEVQATTASVRANFAEIKAQLDNAGTDIDTGTTALTTHESDASTHGVGEVVGTSEAQTLTTKTLVVASNTVTTAAAGNLSATELNAALAELDGQDTTNATAISDHIADATDAHAGSAITNTPAGTIAATTAQGAIDELNTDATDHLGDTTDAHDASAISYVNTTSGLTAAAVQAALDEYDPILKHSAGNGIYNGKMTISQRGDYTSPTTAYNTYYYLDRWSSFVSAVTANIQDTSGAVKVIATSTGTGLIGARQHVENYGYYAGQVVTVSAKVTSNNANARLVVNDGTYLSETTHSGSGSEELLTSTVTIRSGATLLQVRCWIGGDNAVGASITSGDYIEFTDVRLDLGSHRLSGDREYGEELALCREYWHQEISAATYSRHGAGYAQSTVTARIYVYTPHLRTIADTINWGTLQLNDGAAVHTVTAVSVQAASVAGITELVVTSTGLTQFRPYTLINNNSTSGYLGLGNEL